MNKHKALFMMVGLPGVGKSTFIKKNYNSGEVIISTDDIIEAYAAENNLSYTTAFKDGMKIAKVEMPKRLAAAIDEGKSIVWDQTNITKKSRIEKLGQVPSSYFKIAVVFDTPDDEEHERRLASRPHKFIPRDVVADMKKNFKPVTLDEGFDGIMRIGVDGEFPI